MSEMLRLAARTYARYAAPLTVLAAVLFAPLLAFGFFAKAPATSSAAKQLVMISWATVGTAWIAQYMLAGAAAPLARSIAATAPLSQLAAVRASVAGLARAILPIVIVVAAVVLGSIALVIPGLVLVALFSLAGTSTRTGLSEPLLDSAHVVRSNLRLALLALAAIAILDLAVMVVPFFTVLGTLPPKPSADDLAAASRLVQVVAIGIVIVSPVVASILAAVAIRARRTA